MSLECVVQVREKNQAYQKWVSEGDWEERKKLRETMKDRSKNAKFLKDRDLNWHWEKQAAQVEGAQDKDKYSMINKILNIENWNVNPVKDE